MDRGMLARATDGTDAPTPGYLYVDLSRAAASNPAAAGDMATYLCRRLETKQSPAIKQKCCKVIAKICASVPAFRRAVSQNAQHVAVIKEALNYRGAMDPVRGDEANERVRKAAKEALDAVYTEAPSSMGGSGYGGVGGGGVSASYAPSPHQQYQGGGGGGGYPPPQSRRMEGVGNPMYADPRFAQSQQPSNIREAVSEAKEVIVGMIRDPLARNVQPPPTNQGHSGDLPGYNRSQQRYGQPPPGAAELSRQTGGKWNMASNRGPGAIQHQPVSQPQAHHSYNTGAVGGSWGAAAPAQSINHSNPSYGAPPAPSFSAGTAQSDGSFEKNMILELCPPGGVKPVPPPDKLNNFRKALASLNADMICPVILDCLEDGEPWAKRAKALCVMETCIQHGTQMTTGDNPYRNFFHACLEEVRPLASHPRSAIHDPARRVLQLLGVDASTVAPAAAAAAPAANLLDFDDAPAPAAPTPATPSSMFGGMQVKRAAAPPVAAAPVAAAPTSGDLLGDLASPSATAPAASVVDAFAPVAQQEGTKTTDMFAAMTVKDEEPKAEEPAPAPAGGSAFGFINGGEEKLAAPAAPTPTETVNSSSFDPLQNGDSTTAANNLTPNTAQRKMMQMSPEQMQAMLQQQMMWQQQQQILAMRANPMMMMPNMAAFAAAQQQQQQQPTQQRFSLQQPVARKDDKKFDFVKDAMQSAGKK